MPVSLKDSPAGLRPYLFHGVDLNQPASGLSQATGTCPFCHRDKFAVNTETGLAQCWGHQLGDGKGGGLNPLSFLRLLHEESNKDQSGPDKTNRPGQLAGERGLLKAESLTAWGVVRSCISGQWLIPGYDPDGTVYQLYRWTRIKSDKTGDWKYRLLPTPGVHDDGKAHGIHGVAPLVGKKTKTIYLTEGFWDGVALWEALGMAKARDDGTFRLTADHKGSLLSGSAVLAIPGASVFRDSWLPLFSGRDVVLCCQSDHPLEVNGTPQSPVSLMAMRRLAGRFMGMKKPPSSIRYLSWGKEGYDPDRPSGWDVRDHLQQGTTVGERVELLGELLAKIEPIPEDWLSSFSGSGGGSGSILDAIPCSDWKELVLAWHKALKWTEGLELGLAVMLASVLSTETVGEQLWIKLMSPASSGKTSLCEAVSVAQEYILPRSTLREVYSGYKLDKEGAKDYSTAALLRGKTLVVKDGDTLLRNPARATILSQYRDLFDGVGRSQFNNGTSRDYNAVRFTFVLCGTFSLYELDASDLGTRFINCCLMHGIDPDFERDVNRRVAYRAFTNVKQMANGTPETQLDPAMVLARQLTGGYVIHLRRNAEQLLARVEVTDTQVEKIIRYGEFVAMLRARPTLKQEEVVEREFSPRLVEQFARLTSCLTAVMGRTQVDEEVMARVRKVVMDTAYGRTLRIVRELAKVGTIGLETCGLTQRIHETDDKLKILMTFLRQIGVVELFMPDGVLGIKLMGRWRLTSRMTQLYDEVMEVADA